MTNDNTNNLNHAARESVLTMDDIAAVAKERDGSGTDPLDRFPALKTVARDFCIAMGLEMVCNGVPVPLADRVVGRANALTTLAALAMHRAIWNAVLPTDGLETRQNPNS